MKLKTVLSTAVLTFGLFAASSAHAVSSYYTDLVNIYGSNTGCYVCHTGERGDMLPFGNAFLNASGTPSQRLASLDTVVNPQSGNTYGADLRTGGVLPDTKTGGDDEDELGGCVISQAPISLLMFMALIGLALISNRKKQV